jgi:uncharacterized protein YndB with AHSA1/START domain
MTWLYVSKVIAIELCPRRSDTTLGCTPADSCDGGIAVAQVMEADGGHADCRPYDAGMEQSITVEIAAPAERVWEVLTDVEQWSEWTETVIWVRRLDEGPLRSGSRAKINQPKIPETEYVVTELDPGRSFTWVATGPRVTTTARHDVEALPGGGSRVTLAVEQGGWLGSVMGRFYRGLTDRYLANEAAGLKSRCEGER